MGSGPSTPVTEPPRFFRQKILFVLFGLGLLYAAFAFAYPNPWIETPLGLVTLFVTPGYAVGALILGSRPRWAWTLTFVLVVAVSVAINVGVGIILLRLGLGLPATDFAVLSLVLVLLAMFLAGLPRTTPGPPRLRPFLKREFLLEGHSRAQRSMAYGLLIAIVFVLVVIIYLASVTPNQGPGLSFGLIGPGGVTANLPPNGTINSTVQIWIVVGNNGTSQTLTIAVQSVLTGQTPPAYSTTNWTYPIPLGNGVRSSEFLALSPGQSFTIHGRFIFAQGGDYTVTFLMETGKGAVLRSAEWAVNIT
jgi:uncharacterized membrane protein